MVGAFLDSIRDPGTFTRHVKGARIVVEFGPLLSLFFLLSFEILVGITLWKRLRSQGKLLAELEYFSVFLILPQGSIILHSFFTRWRSFCIARCKVVAESGSSENVKFPELAE
jgi:hypothetical protein